MSPIELSWTANKAQKCNTRFHSQGMILNGFQKIIFQNRYVELETLPPFMAKTILNFHFDYLKPSLIQLVWASIFFQVGWTAIFALNFAIIGANLLYILFVVKEKQKPAEKRTSGDCFVFSQI